ncbi:tetratricopeptide repeat protein [Bartonella sp. DGB1]|uniref:tetratricopeptide repeat protein n=1 Tax=Bartonella sp. DGB1 TaxID=3239807 RepID=UPI003523CC31
MSDDGFIREVNEELRKDKIISFWHRYAIYIVFFVGLIIFAAAVHQSYKYFQLQKAEKSSELLLVMSDATEITPEFLVQLQQIKDYKIGAYPTLANFKYAALLIANNDKKTALNIFENILADTSISPMLRNIARVNAGYLLLDDATYDEIHDKVGDLAVVGNPLEFLAIELLAYAAYFNGDYKQAYDLFKQIVDLNSEDPDLTNRAGLMLMQLSSTNK